MNLPVWADSHAPIPDPGSDGERTAERLVRQYARPHRAMLASVQAIVQGPLADAPYVGVHFRGTDTRQGFEGRSAGDCGRVFPRLDLALDAVDKVFGATDEAAVVTRFLIRYENRLVVSDARRSHDGRSIHGHHDAGLAYSPVAKGCEALTDALVLARATRFFASQSRVSDFVRHYNTELPVEAWA